MGIASSPSFGSMSSTAASMDKCWTFLSSEYAAGRIEVPSSQSLSAHHTDTNRLIWDEHLHNRFVQVVESLGQNAIPSKILKEMKTIGLTRTNISSHLQKYRRKMKKRLSNANGTDGAPKTKSKKKLW